MKKALTAIFILCFVSSLSADVVLYLYPGVVARKAGIALNSIALIDARGVEKERAMEITIPEDLYRDGYIDRRELYGYLNRHLSVSLQIFGSAVRVTHLRNIQKEPVKRIARGAAVTVIFSAGSIYIEARGKALRGGMPGEVIPVKVNEKIFKAVVLDNNRVKKRI